MKILMVLYCAVFFLTSCGKTYNCTVVTDIGFASAKITTEKKFRGTYDQMSAYEKANTTDKKTTTCH